MKLASRVEGLVEFSPTETSIELVQFEQWEEPMDFSVVRFSMTKDHKEVLEYILRLSDEGAIECISISAESKNLKTLHVFRSGNEDFNEPILVSDVSFHGRYIESQFLNAVDEYLNKINALSALVTGTNWEVKRGQVGSDVQYAVTAALFVALQKYSSQSVLNRCAEILGIPYEGAKTRLRTARSRGLLTMPGMGSTSSELTKKAKDMLKKEGICEY